MAIVTLDFKLCIESTTFLFKASGPQGSKCAMMLASHVNGQYDSGLGRCMVGRSAGRGLPRHTAIGPDAGPGRSHARTSETDLSERCLGTSPADPTTNARADSKTTGLIGHPRNMIFAFRTRMPIHMRVTMASLVLAHSKAICNVLPGPRRVLRVGVTTSSTFWCMSTPAKVHREWFIVDRNPLRPLYCTMAGNTILYICAVSWTLMYIERDWQSFRTRCSRYRGKHDRFGNSACERDWSFVTGSRYEGLRTGELDSTTRVCWTIIVGDDADGGRRERQDSVYATIYVGQKGEAKERAGDSEGAMYRME